MSRLLAHTGCAGPAVRWNCPGALGLGRTAAPWVFTSLAAG